MKKILHNKTFTTALGVLFAFLGGFVFSGTAIDGIASFADISLAGAVGFPYCPMVFAGALIRCIVSDSIGKSIIKLSAISVIVIIKMFTSGSSERSVSCGIVTAAGVFVAGAGVSSLIGEFPDKLLFYILYGALSGFTAYSAAELIRSISQKKVVDLNGMPGCACGMLYVVLTAALCSAATPAVNAGVVLGAAVTLFGAFFHGTGGGLICGALASGGASLAAADIGLTASVLPVAGLISGVAFRGKIFLSAAFFSLAAFALTVLMGDSASAELTVSIIFGAAVFVAAAPYYSDKWFSLTSPQNRDTDINSIRRNFLSDAIAAVRSDSQRISAALSAVSSDEVAKLKNARTVCGSCYRRGLCRNDLSETAEELIPILPDDCSRKSEVIRSLEADLRSRTARQLMHLRYSESCKLLNEQLRITEELVRSSAEAKEIRFSESVSSRIARKLKLHDIKPLRVAAGYNTSNRLIVEIYFAADDIPESPEKICSLISDELERKMIAADSVSSAAEMRITVCEPPAHEVEVYTASKCARGSVLSGDSCSVFTDINGDLCAVLSDGMGSGKSAAVDSRMVISLFKRLMCSGMDISPAVRMINSLMITKSREESFATLDSLKIDLDTCRVTSVKAGAAPTMIRKGGEVIKLTSTAFPIGIIEEAEITIAEHQLAPDDIIIMFSDGINESAGLFIKETLMQSTDLRETVQEIAVKAELFSTAQRSDDVTVIGIKITE